MNQKVSLFDKIISIFEKSANERVAKELLQLSDSQLLDMGFDRKKLKQGAKAWPWNLEEEKLAPLQLASVTEFKLPTQEFDPSNDHDDHTPIAA